MNAYKRLISTKDMDKQTWIEHRLKGIGGSDAGIIMGVSPFRSVLQLWEEKTGKITVNSDESNIQHFGHVLEDVVRKEFERQTGFKVSIRRCIYQSINHPFMIADVDGIVTEPDGTKAIFEAKTTSAFNREEWKKGEIPLHYIYQIQHYMAVMGLNKAYIACLVGGQEFYWYKVDRDEELIAELIKKEADFWNRVMSGVLPDVDGSKPTTDYLNSQYKSGKKEEIVLPEDAKEIAERYLLLDENIKALQAERELASNQLKMMMADNEIGVAGEHLIKWSFRTRSSLDTKLVKKVLGERYQEFIKETKYRTLSVA